MKHFKPLQTVYHGDRHIGTMLYSARGWQTYDHNNKLVGEYEDDQAAVRRLRYLARQST
jgi:hypothetical protein